jgi:hypothetical protein
LASDNLSVSHTSLTDKQIYMPLEVKELHIKAVVQEAPPKPMSGQSNAGITANQMNAIISECVEQVLNILKEKEER